MLKRDIETRAVKRRGKGDCEDAVSVKRNKKSKYSGNKTMNSYGRMTRYGSNQNNKEALNVTVIKAKHLCTVS